MATVRVRFAPSPTGYLHVGGLRTALYNFLYARHHGGTFLLRIEDTDQTRTVAGAAENLIAMLEWCGITYDEGPGKEGSVGPYIQSERLPTYAHHAQQLIDSGHAYRCFCTAERLEAVRKQFQAQKLPPMYDRNCRSVPAAESAERAASGESHVIRMLVPLHDEIVFHDVIRGAIAVQGKLLDDQVLMKSDGFPTYHLANVVDDHLMGITDVIRGEEWLPSTPKHMLLYAAFGWEPPRFAHLPLLLNADKSKLSKRQGDVAVEDYQSKGFLPEALVNFVALLGWNPSAEQELYALQELIERFDLASVNKAGAVFDVNKLQWMNAQYLRHGDLQRVADRLAALLAARGVIADRAYVAKVAHVMKERVETLNDFVEFGDYFFSPPSNFEAPYMAKHWVQGTANRVRALTERLRTLDPFTAASIEQCVRLYAGEQDIKPAALIHPLRLALTGKSVGPGLFELVEVLGREESCSRLEHFLSEHP